MAEAKVPEPILELAVEWRAMSDLRGDLNRRIKKLGEGVGTDDPLIADAILLISRTLVDIHDAESTGYGEVNVRLANPPRLNFMESYRFEQVLNEYDEKFRSVVAVARNMERNAEEFKKAVVDLSRALWWLSVGVACLCTLGTMWVLWTIFAG